MYAITSYKNGYEINGNSFVQACQRYGFDSPFPFVHVCYKNKTKPQKEETIEGENSAPILKKEQKEQKTLPST